MRDVITPVLSHCKRAVDLVRSLEHVAVSAISELTTNEKLELHRRLIQESKPKILASSIMKTGVRARKKGRKNERQE